MKKEEQSQVHVFKKAIEKYINLMNAQMKASPMIMNTLTARLKANSDRMTKFMNLNHIQQDRDEEQNQVVISVPLSLAKNFEKYNTEIKQSVSALQLTPQNLVVAFVSIYDAFLADIIEGMYKMCPQKLNSCARTYTSSDILQFGSIDEIKDHLIEKEVESVLRESHANQFEWLKKTLNVELTKDLPNYKHFIEITERRNLFVHTNGKISRQYMKCCKKNGISIDNMSLGAHVKATPSYVLHCYNILFEIGIKLGQVVWRKIDSKNSLEEADSMLMDIIYDLLKTQKYDLAINLSEFATASYVKDYNKLHEYVKCVNKALAYYLSGNKQKCNECVNSIDWSATEHRFKLASKVLLEDFESACNIMREMGALENLQNAFREWPLFTKFREEALFKTTYKEIFSKDFEFMEIKPIGWEDVVKESLSIVEEINKHKEEAVQNSNSVHKEGE